jgi:hypothetical protein
MSNSNNQTVSLQQARQIGQNGGNVSTQGMAHQTARRIDAAVNLGRQNPPPNRK